MSEQPNAPTTESVILHEKQCRKGDCESYIVRSYPDSVPSDTKCPTCHN